MSSTLQIRRRATEQDPRWQAVVARDGAFDDRFVYAVRTTGVYCRPSCPTRPARPENVGFHATREEAERAGFRPCKRCKPEQIGDKMKKALRYALGHSSLGDFVVATSDRGVAMIAFGQSWQSELTLQERFPEAALVEDRNGLGETLRRVAELIEHPERKHDLALDLRGSDFEQRVWRALQEVPAGETVSYGEIAMRLGVPRQAKEVAEACAANVLAVVVPCHRVVKKDGSISGYRWGTRRKRALLEREHRALFHLA